MTVDQGYGGESPDTGFRCAADEIAALFDEQRGAVEEVLASGERCARLWSAVIRKALDDLAFLRRAKGEHDTTKHFAQKVRRIQENPPSEFFEGSWFTEICEHLGVDPEFVRETCGLHRFAA